MSGISVESFPSHLWRDKWTTLSGPLAPTISYISRGGVHVGLGPAKSCAHNLFIVRQRPRQPSYRTALLQQDAQRTICDKLQSSTNRIKHAQPESNPKPH